MNSTTTTKPAPAVVHNVYFWLKKGLSEADRALFVAELNRLPRIAYLELGCVGAPAPVEVRPVSDASFDYALSVHFKSLADLEFYQKRCAEHARFIATCKHLWERVLVYDSAPLG
jgi:hypothetical protein